MKTKLITVAAALLLTTPALAQSVATPAGTDMTGTTEVGIQTTGTREMTTGASGNSGVVGRGIGHQSANIDTNKDSPNDMSGAPTDRPSAATNAAKRHPAGTTTDYND